ncbi:MAG: hypothetical protein QXK07_04290 [Desulfurococcaceae archaeon]
MEYEVEERRATDDRRYDLNIFAKKFVEQVQIPFGLGTLPELRKLFKEDKPKLEFLTPVKSNLFVYDSFFDRNIIIFDRRSFEITGIEIDFKRLRTVLMAKSHSGKRTYIDFYYFSDLIGFLFYSGAYEKIREGKYRGSTEFAETILDFGELVYNNPSILQYLPIETKRYSKLIEYTVWIELEEVSGYAGIVIEPPGKLYSLIIYNDSMFHLFEIGISESIIGFRALSRLNLSTANNLPLVRLIIDSFNDIRNELEKYINNLRLAYIAMKTFKTLIGD